MSNQPDLSDAVGQPVEASTLQPEAGVSQDSQVAQTAATVYTIPRHWPVPQITVFYRDKKFAMGRDAIANMGKREFMSALFIMHVWVRPYPGVKWQDHYYQNHNFSKTATIRATFYYTHGDHDVGPLPLSGLGWAEMIQNVVTIELIYSDE